MNQEKMEAMAGRTTTTELKVAPSPFNDGRMQDLQSKARELKVLNRELSEMIVFKVDALLGSVPPVPETDEIKDSHADGWVEETMREINDGIKACRYSLERLSVV